MAILVVVEKLAPQLYLTPLLISCYWNTCDHCSHVIRSLNKRPRRKIQVVHKPQPARKSQYMQFTPGHCFCRNEWLWIPFTFHTTPSSPAIWFGGFIRKILGVGELSHFYKPSYCCVSWLVCIYVLLRISSLITHRAISSGSHWIKLTTWLKSDNGYQSIRAAWFEIRCLLLFHGNNKGQGTSMENKRI